MKKKIYLIRFIAALISLVVCFVLLSPVTLQIDVSGSSVKEMQNEYDKKESELEKLKKELTALKKDKSKVMATKRNYDLQIDNIEGQISNLNTQISLLNNDISRCNDQIGKLNRNIEDKNNNITSLNQQINQNYSLFQQRMRALYMEGDASMLDILLGSSSFFDFVSKYTLIESIIEHDKELIVGLNRDKKTVNDEKKAIEETKGKIEDAKKEIEQNKASIVSMKNTLNQKRSEVAKLSAEASALISDMEKDQKALERQQKQEEAEMAAIDKKIKDAMANSDVTPSGKAFAWPVPGYSYIISPFGTRRDPFSGVIKFHRAIDITGANINGKRIVATNDGEVLRAQNVVTPETAGSYGKYVSINHGNGIVSLYAHCSRVVVKPGQKVKKGDTIAYVGSTGYSTGAHLHFEIRENNVHVNPLKYVSPKS